MKPRQQLHEVRLRGLPSRRDAEGTWHDTESRVSARIPPERRSSRDAFGQRIRWRRMGRLRGWPHGVTRWRDALGRSKFSRWGELSSGGWFLNSSIRRIGACSASVASSRAVQHRLRRTGREDGSRKAEAPGLLIESVAVDGPSDGDCHPCFRTIRRGPEEGVRGCRCGTRGGTLRLGSIP